MSFALTLDQRQFALNRALATNLHDVIDYVQSMPCDYIEAACSQTAEQRDAFIERSRKSAEAASRLACLVAAILRDMTWCPDAGRLVISADGVPSVTDEKLSLSDLVREEVWREMGHL